MAGDAFGVRSRLATRDLTDGSAGPTVTAVSDDFVFTAGGGGGGGGGMAWSGSIVQTATGNSGNSSATGATVAFTNAVGTGNVVYIFFFGTVAYLTPPTGFTDDTNGAAQILVAKQADIGSTHSWAFSFSSQEVVFVAFEISKVTAQSGLVPTSTTSTTASVTTPTPTVSADSIVIGVSSSGRSGTALTLSSGPSGWTAIGTSGGTTVGGGYNLNLTAYYKEETTAATGTFTWSASGANLSGDIIVSPVVAGSIPNVNMAPQRN